MIIRWLSLLVALGMVLGLAGPASSQIVVSDPIVEQLAAKSWVQDLQNAQQFIQIATNGASQLKQQIQQTILQLQNAQTLSAAQVAMRSAQSEWTSLQSLARVTQGMIAATGHASSDIATAFPGASTANQASVMAAQEQTTMKGTIMSAAQTVDARLNQMQSEETMLQNLRTQVQNAQSGNLGTNQLLQLGLTIASEQLDEIRSLERMMAIQFQAQQAYMYAHSNDQTKAILGQASVEAFFAPMASPAP